MLALDPQVPVQHDPFGTWLRPGCPCGGTKPKNASTGTATSDVGDRSHRTLPGPTASGWASRAREGTSRMCEFPPYCLYQTSCSIPAGCQGRTLRAACVHCTPFCRLADFLATPSRLEHWRIIESSLLRSSMVGNCPIPLAGSVPDSLSLLQNLESINLAGCGLFGSLPAGYSTLQKLRSV